MKSIDRLIINSPYEEPTQHWSHNRDAQSFERTEGRRSAGYMVASQESKAANDPGLFVAIPCVNQIRQRVKEWRSHGYPGVSAITRRLLAYWQDPEEFSVRRFFYCQLEAAETLIWLTEGPEQDRVGLDIPSDGGPFQRACAKMATGSGKTVVMAMVIAWHILNKVTTPQRLHYSKHVLIVAPGLTVKNRLQVLNPTCANNYYEAFRIVPSPLLDKLRQGKVLIRNWHALGWETEEKFAAKKGVDKRGALSDEAYLRQALGELARRRNLLVINDEAHHAWRLAPDSSPKGIEKKKIEEATKWVGSLDRIHRARGITACYDFSATPFTPSGKKSTNDALFKWIVSDFGLNDAIEAGLVKTPRVVVRDDGVPDSKSFTSKFYHIFNEPDVKHDLARKAEKTEPLPDLVINAYYFLGVDWRETAKSWKNLGMDTPPVLITVANRTETAARVKYAFDSGRIQIPELCDPEKTLHIDSRVLAFAESSDKPVDLPNDGKSVTTKRTKKENAELLRQQVDTVGKLGELGETIQNVISVGMLSEGWDAKTVTHIMGLRAFASQLLCEQVIGRGLRRTSYETNPETGLFEPEYVNIFGIPFTFLPHEHSDNIPPPPPPKVEVRVLPERHNDYEITWPKVVRIDRTLEPRLTVNWEMLPDLHLAAGQTAKLAELAPVIEGKPDYERIERISLEALAQEYRFQRIAFETAHQIISSRKPDWEGSKGYHMAQLVKLVEDFVLTDKISIEPVTLGHDAFGRRLIITLNLNKLVRHIWHGITASSTVMLEVQFDAEEPIGSTASMQTWYTGRSNGLTKRSHINRCIFDSTWEASAAYVLDHNTEVDAWVKNDHLGFSIYYVYGGVVRKYVPDFLIRMKSGTMLVLETKGKYTERDKAKRAYLDEWVQAVNAHGGFGEWSSAISFSPSDICGILARHSRTSGIAA